MTSYQSSGVDIAAGERAVELMRPWVEKASRPEVVGGLGGFAGLFRIDPSRWRDPLLASSTDGVGTKVALAQALGRHDTIGIDLVAMIADDVVVCGAEPLFCQDYIACGRLVPERIAEIVSGIAEGCRQAGCALVGGETAEHPGLLGQDEYDVAGTVVGIVEADAVLGPARVSEGDAVIALGSSGLHANGYSLVRRVLADRIEEFGDELLTPTRIYAKDCQALAAAGDVHAFAHVTGGGLAGNLARVLPPTLGAVIDRSTWRPQPIFAVIQDRGDVSQAEMERTFNMGIGMVAVVGAADDALRTLAERGVPAWVAGRITRESGVRLIGTHR